MDHLPRDIVQFCMESGCRSELRRNSGFQKPSSVQAEVLGKCVGEPDSKLAGGTGALDSPCPNTGLWLLEVPWSEAQRQEKYLYLYTLPFCAGGKQGWPSECSGPSGS